MGQKMYNVTIQGITKQYPEKIPYSEIVKEYEGSTDAPVMLVIVDDLAFIVNVPNKTVVTAMNSRETEENVFTNINGAVIM